jgi:DnaK suppressor protein
VTAHLQAIKRTLESKLREVRSNLGELDSIRIEPSADPVDMTQQAEEREIATQNLDRNALLARQILAALARLEERAYGVCTECEENISPKRLAVIPWAGLCIHCQEKEDAEHGIRPGSIPAAVRASVLIAA